MKKLNKIEKDFYLCVLVPIVVLFGLTSGLIWWFHNYSVNVEEKHEALLEKDYVMNLGDSFYFDQLTFTGMNPNSLMFERKKYKDSTYMVPAKENTSFTLSNEVKTYTFKIIEIRKETNAIVLHITKEKKSTDK